MSTNFLLSLQFAVKQVWQSPGKVEILSVNQEIELIPSENYGIMKNNKRENFGENQSKVTGEYRSM